MAKQAESKSSKKIIDELKALGWKATKNHGGPFSERGRPDIQAIKRRPDGTCCYVEIENKEPGKKPTGLQLKWIRETNEQGGIAFWCVGWAEAQQEMIKRGLI